MHFPPILTAVLLFSVLASTGCPRQVVRIGPNYQAEVEAEVDFAAAMVPVLDERMGRYTSAEEHDQCRRLASYYIYARYWVPHLAALKLAAAGLGEEPDKEPVVPTPDGLCE